MLYLLLSKYIFFLTVYILVHLLDGYNSFQWALGICYSLYQVICQFYLLLISSRPHQTGTITTISRLQMRKMRIREVKWLEQYYILWSSCIWAVTANLLPPTHTHKKKHTQLLLKDFKKGLKQRILHESAQNTNTHQCSKIPIRHYLFIDSWCETKPVFFLNNEKIHTYCIFFLRLNLTTQ